jgi:hypothetical protein
LPHITREIKSRGIILAKLVAHVRREKKCIQIVANPDFKRHFGRHRCRCENNIKVDISFKVSKHKIDLRHHTWNLSHSCGTVFINL